MAHKLRCGKCNSENRRTETNRKSRYHVCLDCGHIFYAVKRHRQHRNYQYAEPIGYRESGIFEISDCAVRATAIAANVEYKDAHALYELAGRQQRKGTYVWTMTKAFEIAKDLQLARIEAIELLGFFTSEQLERPDSEREYARHITGRWPHTVHCYRSKYRPVTLAMLKPHVAKGRYIATNRNHAFAIIDGVVHDSGSHGPQIQICNLWEVQ